MWNKLRQLFNSQKFYSLAGSVSAAGFSLLNFALLARVLTKEEFGYWGFFLTIFGLFDMVRNGLVGRPLVKMSTEGDEDYFWRLISSAFKISMRTTFLISAAVGLVFAIVYLINKDTFYLDLIMWFAICAFATIPASFAVWINTSKINFKRVVMVNGSKRFLFLVGVVVVYILDLDLKAVFFTYALAAVLTSVMTMVLRWSFLRQAVKYSADQVKKIFDFGKFSMGTMLGSSALTSSDNLLIMAFLGPEALAIYQVPMRIIGLHDIPLRSLVQHAFPTLAGVKNKHDSASFQKEFEISNGFTFLALLPLCILIFVFAEPLLAIIGGAEYAGTEAVLIIRFFSVYLAVTPLDRFAGLALDVLNRPNLNFRKMMLMLVVNIVGDLLVFQLGGGVAYVAIASIATFFIGTFIGYYYLRKDLPFRLKPLIREGQGEITKICKKMLSV